MTESNNVFFVPQHVQVRRIEDAVREYRANRVSVKHSYLSLKLFIASIVFAAPFAIAAGVA